jgi:hypothetical protein
VSAIKVSTRIKSISLAGVQDVSPILDVINAESALVHSELSVCIQFAVNQAPTGRVRARSHGVAPAESATGPGDGRQVPGSQFLT